MLNAPLESTEAVRCCGGVEASLSETELALLAALETTPFTAGAESFGFDAPQAASAIDSAIAPKTGAALGRRQQEGFAFIRSP
jgi:hypothetical protein